MNQLFRQNPFLRVALFFGIGSYLLDSPLLFWGQLAACAFGICAYPFIKTKIFHSALMAGVILALGSSQQFLIEPLDKKEFIATQPFSSFKQKSTNKENESIFQVFLQHHDSSDAGLMVALLVGDTQYVSSEEKQEYQILGLSHLLAVSGMHIGLIFQSVLLLLQKTTRYQTPKLSAITGLIIIWGFAHITHYSPSLVRACIMFSIIHLGKMFNTKSGAINALCVSFVSMLIFDPLMRFHWGFILSHLAVLGIILHHRRWQALTQDLKVWKRWIIQSLVTTWGAQLYTSIFLVPITLLIPTYFLISNFLLMPLFSVLLFTCFIEWIIGLCFNTIPFFQINDLIFHWIHSILSKLSNLPSLQYQLHASWFLVLVGIITIVMVYYCILESKWKKGLSIALVGGNSILILSTVNILLSPPEIHCWRKNGQKNILWSHQSIGFVTSPEKRLSTFMVQKGVELNQSP